MRKFIARAKAKAKAKAASPDLEEIVIASLPPKEDAPSQDIPQADHKDQKNAVDTLRSIEIVEAALLQGITRISDLKLAFVDGISEARLRDLIHAVQVKWTTLGVTKATELSLGEARARVQNITGELWNIYNTPNLHPKLKLKALSQLLEAADRMETLDGLSTQALVNIRITSQRSSSAKDIGDAIEKHGQKIELLRKFFNFVENQKKDVIEDGEVIEGDKNG